MDDIRIVTIFGHDLLAYVDDLARLRIEVFREWPYLYDGDREYERKYLSTYARCPQAFCALAIDGDEIVGASTAIPLVQEPPGVQKPFEDDDWGVESVYYFGESVLLPEYRGRGIGKRFMEEREKAALGLGFPWCAFCAVERSLDDPRRPTGYQPINGFWQSRGFVCREDLRTTFSWKEIGEDTESPKVMVFWVKRLEE